MTDPTHNPDPLGAATDRVVALIVALLPKGKCPIAVQLGRALSDLFAELIGRASVQSASTIVVVNDKVERLAAQVIDLERRERARSERVVELERTMNGRVDELWREHEAHPDLAAAVYTLARDVEQLKERQAGDGGGER